MARSIAAVIAGYLLFAASAVILFQTAGVDPEATPAATFFVFGTLYGALFGALGGFLAAVIARRKPLRHAQVVATLIALGSVVSLVAQWGEGGETEPSGLSLPRSS